MHHPMLIDLKPQSYENETKAINVYFDVKYLVVDSPSTINKCSNENKQLVLKEVIDSRTMQLAGRLYGIKYQVHVLFILNLFTYQFFQPGKVRFFVFA